MGLELFTRIIYNNNDLIEFVRSFDADISGENGLEYTSKEAVDKGFKSDIDYFISEAERVYIYDFGKIVYDVMLNISCTYDNDYFIGSEFSVLTTNDGLSVSFAYCSK